MFFEGDHWQYYNDNFDWPSSASLPDMEATRKFYSDLGLSAPEADTLIASGYVSLTGQTIIDRYYGGALLSSDGTTRIDRALFKEWYGLARSAIPLSSQVMVSTATSIADLEEQIQQLQQRIGHQLLYRGQTMHYRLTRAITNPALLVAEFGEPSFVPSIWRRMLATQPNSFHHFNGLSLFEWSKIIYSQFDKEDIDRRVAKENITGMHFSAQDMEDSDDQVLSLFGRVRLDLEMGINLNLADLLNTLMQHYGLASPYLDLTADLRTGFFFASHEFNSGSPLSTYRHVGNNGGKSVIYVFRRKKDEMAEYAKDRVLHDLNPLRPERQSCVICRSSPYAINLAGLYLVAIFRIGFELPSSDRLSTSDLFPAPKDDRFLSAILKQCFQSNLITQF